MHDRNRSIRVSLFGVINETARLPHAPTGMTHSPHSFPPRLALTLLAMAQLIIALDATIIFVALHEMGVQLQINAQQLQWIVSGYTVALAVANGEADVATNNTADFSRFTLQFPAEAGSLKVLWQSELIPHAQIVVRRDYPPELQRQVQQFLIGYARRPGPGGDAERRQHVRAVDARALEQVGDEPRAGQPARDVVLQVRVEEAVARVQLGRGADAQHREVERVEPEPLARLGEPRVRVRRRAAVGERERLLVGDVEPAERVGRVGVVRRDALHSRHHAAVDEVEADGRGFGHRAQI